MYFFRLLYLFKIDNHDTAMDNCGNKVNKDPVCIKYMTLEHLQQEDRKPK